MHKGRPMKFLFDNSIQGKVTFSSALPMEYTMYHIPLAKVNFISGPFGSILSQQIKGLDYEVWQHHFFIESDLTVHPFTDKRVIALHYLLKGNIQCRLAGFGELALEEDKSHLFYVPSLNNDALLTPGTHISFHINFSPVYLRQLVTKYTPLKELLDHHEAVSEYGLQEYAANISEKAKAIIEEIKCCSLGMIEKELFLQARIRDLLLEYISLSPRESIDQILAEDDSLVDQIKTFINNNLELSLDIGSIAKRFHMSESTLKRQFKDHSSYSIHEYVYIERMVAAKKLIETTTLSVTAISEKVGYNEPASFIRAFIRHFHHSPSFFRDYA